jgi:hypothetical protein
VSFDEVVGDERAQRSGAAGDENGSAPSRTVRGAGRLCGVRADESWSEASSVAKRELSVVARDVEGGEQGVPRGVLAVGIDEEDRQRGMLVLGRADESPERRVREVQDVFVGCRGDGALGEQDEARGGEAFVGDPGLEKGECAGRGTVGGEDDLGVRAAEGREDDVGSAFAPVEGEQESGEICESLGGALEVSVAEDDDVAGGRSGRRLAELGPCELEQGIAMEGGGAMDLVRGGYSGGEGSHEGDGLTCGVGKCELDVAVMSDDAPAESGGADGA